MKRLFLKFLESDSKIGRIVLFTLSFAGWVLFVYLIRH